MKPHCNSKQPKTKQPLCPDYDLCHYRLKTKRQKRRLVIKDRDKQLLALNRESKALSKQQREQPLEPLTPPIQRGWKRFFVLREDVAQSQQAAFYEGILARINTTEHHHDRRFKQRKRKMGRKIYVVREQHLRKLSEWDWHQAAFNPKEAALFETRQETCQGGHGMHTIYVFTESWRFVLRVAPHLITHTRVKNLELERRIDWVDDRIWKHPARARLLKLLDGHSYNPWRGWPSKDPMSTRRPFRNRTAHELASQDEW